MKNIVILLCFLLVACQETPVQDNESMNSSETVSPTVSPSKSAVKSPPTSSPNEVTSSRQAANSGSFVNLIVKDREDYSSEFLEELAQIPAAAFDLIELKHNLLIINEIDTLYFPDLPPFGEILSFSGQKDDVKIELVVRRTNQTSMSYESTITEYGNTTTIKQGEVSISAGFILGSESDSTPEGDGYFVWDYGNQEEDCYTNIRIGQLDESNLNDPILVKIIQNCLEGIADIELDDSPILKERH